MSSASAPGRRAAVTADLTEDSEQAANRLAGTFRVRFASDDADAPDPSLPSASGLAIDDALALARKHAGRVTVWLDHDPWDASEPPRRSSRTWPPANLDLRPRWYYEPPDSRRFDRWRLHYEFEAPGVTGELVLLALTGIARIADIREVPLRDPADAGADIVAFEIVIDTADGTSAMDADDIMDAVLAHLPSDDRDLTADQDTDGEDEDGVDGSVETYAALDDGLELHQWLIGPDVPAEEVGAPSNAWAGRA